MGLMDRLNKRIIEEVVGVVEPSPETTAPPPPPDQTQGAAENLLDIATQLQDAINTHQKALDDAQIQLTNIIEKLNTQLGWEIRKRQPKIEVSHRNGKCNAGYYSQILSFRPDLTNKQWNIEGPLSRRFQRRFPEANKMDNDHLTRMADNIVEFFGEHYKTLGQ